MLSTKIKITWNVKCVTIIKQKRHKAHGGSPSQQQDGPTEGEETGVDRKKEDPMVTALKYRFGSRITTCNITLLMSDSP